MPSWAAPAPGTGTASYVCGLDPGTAVPARIDVEWRMAERTIRTTIFRLAWKAELPDSLFEATIPDGWAVVRADR